MKKIGQISLLLVFLLSGCALPRVSSLLATATPPLSHTVPAPTMFSTLSATPPQTLPPLASETPLGTEPAAPTEPTIPLPLTPLPTFDKSLAQQIPQQQPAVCPKVDSSVMVDVAPGEGMKPDALLAYLNAGGDPQVFEKNRDLLSGGIGGTYTDVTGDGVKDIIAGLGDFSTGFSALLCQNGQYHLSSFELADSYTEFTRLEKPQDLNQNGLPELIMEGVHFNHGYEAVCIYEWDGRATFHLISQGCYYTSSSYQIKDINGDGLPEIIVVDDVYDVGIYRDYQALVFKQINILSWDGKEYVNAFPGNYQPPTYRFQATQLGDLQTRRGHYQQALTYYQQAVSDESLKWWSDERVLYENERENNTAPTPVPDTSEYPRLAAYATYRMMILYLHLGQADAARAAYATLQSKYPAGDPGFAYAEMASGFWQTYQATGRMASACQNSIEYAQAHVEMLDALGQARGHGQGLIDYERTPANLCPFPLQDGKRSAAIAVTPATGGVVAVCPAENPATGADFPLNGVLSSEDMLRYLNAGGSPEIFIQKPELLAGGKLTDATGDGINEIIFGAEGGRFNLIGCENAQYRLMPFYFDKAASSSAALKETLDLNQNGIAELIFTAVDDTLGYTSIYLYEWDGVTFRSLIQLVPEPFSPAQITDAVYTMRPYTIEDTNSDGLKDIIVVDDTLAAQYKETQPARNETITLGWDGRHYINLLPGNYDLSKYRFQVITDADRLVLYGNYPKALKMYQQAISDEKLAWWSEDVYMSLKNQANFPAETAPEPDPTGYQLMLGYAYFRSFILYVQMGDMDAATRTYQMMQDEDSLSPYGQPYVEMATHFWEKYVATGGSVYMACSIARDFDPETLAPLGNPTIFGAQSHEYMPEDACPF